MSYFLASRPWSTKAVTTRSFGNRSAKLLIPSGLAMRFKNKIRSSGTPLETKTSTAIVADPPNRSISDVIFRRHRRVKPGSTCCKHGIQKQDPTVGDVFRELVVKQSGLAGLLISLNEYLPNANRAAAVAQALFHRFTCAHD